MSVDTAMLSLENPVFHTFLLAARKSPLNPKPEPAQLQVNEYVDRSRRINLNDLESIPGFLALASCWSWGSFSVIEMAGSAVTCAPGSLSGKSMIGEATSARPRYGPRSHLTRLLRAFASPASPHTGSRPPLARAQSTRARACSATEKAL